MSIEPIKQPDLDPDPTVETMAACIFYGLNESTEKKTSILLNDWPRDVQVNINELLHFIREIRKGNY